MSDAYVYLIGIKEGDVFTAPVKIGISNNPWSRLGTLQTACPYEIGIVAVLSYPNRDIALTMEDCFHTTQKQHRLKGEWFDIPPHKALGILRLHARFIIQASAPSLSEEDKELAITLIEQHL